MSVKISELPILDSLADNDIVAGVDVSGNITSKIEMSTLKNYIDTNTQYTAGTNIDITNNVVSAPNVYNKTETNNLLNAKENISNKVTTLSSSSTNTQYPSAKVVYDELNNLETDLTNDINDLNDEVDNQIQELEEELKSVSTIYNAFPTESDEDESMTLDGTAEVKFKKFDLKGNTSQTTYSGKNLLEPKMATASRNGITCTNNGNGSFTLNGTATAAADFRLDQSQRTGEDNLKSYNGTYTLSCNELINGMQLVVMQNQTWNFLARMSNSNTPNTFTADKDNCFIYVYVESGITLNNLVIRPMVEKGSSATSYEPFVGGTASPNPSYPQPVNVVSGDNEINVCGKNFFEIKEPDYKGQDAWNGYGVDNVYTIIDNGFTFNAKYCGIGWKFNNLIVGEQYTLSFDYEGNKTFWADVGVNEYAAHTEANASLKSYSVSTTKKREKFTFTAAATNRVAFNSGYTDNTTLTISNIQLERGSSVSTYEPYQGNIYNIDLPVENLWNEATQTFANHSRFNNPTKDSNNVWTFTISGTDGYAYATSTISLVAGTYTVSAIVNNGDFLLQKDGTTINNTFTLTETSTITFRVYKNGVVGDVVKLSNVMFEKGSKANSYTPYGTTPIELCKIGNYQDYFGKSDGRNLFDKDNANILNAYFETSTPTLSSNDNARTLYIECSPNTTYTITKLRSQQFNVGCINIEPIIGTTIQKIETGTTGVYDGTTKASYTYTTNSTAKYLLVRYAYATQVDLDLMLSSIQIELGTQASEYEPYGKVWYLHKEINKVVFSNVDYGSLSNYYDINAISIAKTQLGWKSAWTSGVAIMNKYSEVTNASSIASGTFATNLQQGNILIFNSDFTDIETARTTLEGTILYIRLATPTITEITYQPLIDQLNLLEKAMSKDGQTNISQVSNDKPFVLDVTAIKSLQNVLDRIELLES